MGQIETTKSAQRRETYDERLQKTEDDDDDNVLIWECWDFENDPQTLQVIMNENVLTRDDENPYGFLKSTGGRNLVQLKDHAVAHHLPGIGHIEPVEETILEVADFRNLRAEVAVYSVNPFIKIRKDAGITRDDVKFAPMNILELRKMDDVMFERPPEMNFSLKDIELQARNEIEETLAMSEYMSGQPQSKSEPLGKVHVLLGQSNQRLTIGTENIASFYSDMINVMIEMNQEFLSEEVYFRITGKDGSKQFQKFDLADKEVQVDSSVEIEPIIPPDKAARISALTFLLAEMVEKDQPDPMDPESLIRHQIRKRTLFEMVLEELDKGQYVEAFLGPEPEAQPQGAGMVGDPSQIPPKIPLLPLIGEDGAVPEQSPPTAQPEAQGGAVRNMMKKIPLLNKLVK
jgi:hypothetical protein